MGGQQTQTYVGGRVSASENFLGLAVYVFIFSSPPYAVLAVLDVYGRQKESPLPFGKRLPLCVLLEQGNNHAVCGWLVASFIGFWELNGKLLKVYAFACSPIKSCELNSIVLQSCGF